MQSPRPSCTALLAIVNTVHRHHAEVAVQKNGQTADAASVLDLMFLGAVHGTILNRSGFRSPPVICGILFALAHTKSIEFGVTAMVRSYQQAQLVYGCGKDRLLMSTMLGSEKGQFELLSMWFEWPLRFCEGWLSALVMPLAKTPTHQSVDPMTVHEFEMSQNDREVIVVAETPEFKGNELQASIKNNVLNIKGERHNQIDGGEVTVSYNRKVTLPPSINVKEAKTTLQDGLVEVRIPKLRAVEHEESGQKANGKSRAKPQESSKRKSTPAPRASAAAKRSKAKKAQPKKKSQRR